MFTTFEKDIRTNDKVFDTNTKRYWKLGKRDVLYSSGSPYAYEFKLLEVEEFDTHPTPIIFFTRVIDNDLGNKDFRTVDMQHATSIIRELDYSETGGQLSA